MTLYRYKGNDVPGQVTAYKKPSGRNVNLELQGRIVRLPDDETMSENFLETHDDYVEVTDEEAREAKQEDEQEPSGEDLEDKDYRELQQMAKERGIDATQSAEDLKEQLCGDDEEEVEEEPEAEEAESEVEPEAEE